MGDKSLGAHSGMKFEPAESECPGLAGRPLGTGRPPQFGLRSLLVAMAVIGVLCALAQAVGLYSFLVLVFFLGLIAAHVVGNSLGTRLREETDRLAQSGALAADRPPASVIPSATLVRSRLAQRGQLPRALLGFALCGAGLGAAAGGLVIAAVCGELLTTCGILLAVVSFGVLGGLGGFLVGSFYTVARGAWNEAFGKTPRE